MTTNNLLELCARAVRSLRVSPAPIREVLEGNEESYKQYEIEKYWPHDLPAVKAVLQTLAANLDEEDESLTKIITDAYLNADDDMETEIYGRIGRGARAVMKAYFTHLLTKANKGAV